MPGPRLRTVQKAVPPYQLNQFPEQFVQTFAREVVYMLATKSEMSLEGSEWEQIFAKCIGAAWRPSNVGLDDVVLGNCCWSAKTVKAQSNIGTQSIVRLICGRNSPTYSYGVDEITKADPGDIGKMVLDIWNERVSGIRQYFKFARTVVLVKKPDYSEYLIFETETIRYDSELYTFAWNSRGNLEGYTQEGIHKFTWQPSGSQFTIIEEIPKDRLHLNLRLPQKLNQDEVLNALGFDPSWIVRRNDNE